MERTQEPCKIDRAALTEVAFGAAHDPAKAKRQKRHREWEYQNMRTVSTRFGVEEYNKLLRLCAEQGVTVYQLVRELVLLYMLASIRNGALRGGETIVQH